MYIQDKINISARVMTDEGFLVIDNARIARSGIQEYYAGELGLTDRDPFDTIKLYRPEKEVFNDASMQSFSGKIVTNNHPPELINSKNVKDYQVGYSGDNVKQDGIFLNTKITITDEETIKDIEAGKVELSNGYESNIEFVNGKTNDGELYDAIQTSIKGNHIAIVDRARCGSSCKLSDNLKEENKMPKIIVDGVEFEAPEQTAQAVSKVIASNDTLKNKVSALEETIVSKDSEIGTLKTSHQKELDTMQAKIDDAESKKLTPELLDAKVAQRTEIIGVASKVIENFDGKGKDCLTIQKEVITSKFSDLDLTNKSDDYVVARFDAIASDVMAGKSNAMNDGLGEHAKNLDKTEMTDSEKAREEKKKRDKTAWQSKK